MAPTLLLLALASLATAALRQPAGFPPLPLQRTATATAASPVGPTAASQAMTISVIALGGDPTGVADSTAALAAALRAGQALAANNSLPGAAGSGGVLIDLAGGTYRVDSPLLLRGANGLRLAGGTLVAGAAFPPTGCLLDVQFGGNLVLEDLTLDANHTGGCLRLDAVVQVTLSQTFLLHYSSYGVWGDDAHGASHELMVSACFFAEFMWGEPNFDNVAMQNGTAIFLAPQFYDSNFYHSIIRCTRVGVVNMAGANLWHGMHIYSTCNKDPSGGNVSVGMLSAAWGQTRISSCYFDDSPLVVLSAQDITVKDNLVYGLASLTFAPHTHSAPYGAFFSGNIFSNTAYSGLGPALHYDTSAAAFPALLQGVVVAENGGSAAQRAPLRSTRASASVLANASSSGSSAGPLPPYTALLDLRPHLLFLPPNASDGKSQGAAAAAAAAAWRAAAAPVMPAVQRHLALQLPVQQLPWQGAAAAAAAAASAPFGGAFAQVLASTPVLLSVQGQGGVALPLQGCYLAVAAVAPSATAGVLSVLVQLQSLLPPAAGNCTPLDSVTQWSALVTVQVDQASASLLAWA